MPDRYELVPGNEPPPLVNDNGHGRFSDVVAAVYPNDRDPETRGPVVTTAAVFVDGIDGETPTWCSVPPFCIAMNDPIGWLRRVTIYDPAFGDERTCRCGHTYARHFDPFEGMDPVGCKYCQCFEFVEKNDEPLDVDNLPRCPCGGEGALIRRVGLPCYVGCTGGECMAQTPDFWSEQRAADCWARMVRPDEVRRRLNTRDIEGRRDDG